MTASVEETEALPALFEHACLVYKKMEEEAVLERNAPKQEGELGEAQLVWVGHLTKLFAKLRLSVPYYTSVTRELKLMGCIRQRRRGGGSSPSEWLMITEPTEELWRNAQSLREVAPSFKNTKIGMLEQQVRQLTTAVVELRNNEEAILDWIAEQEKNND